MFVNIKTTSAQKKNLRRTSNSQFNQDDDYADYK